MSPTVHLIQGAVTVIVLYPIIDSKAIVFGVSVVAIDLDHFIEYYLQCRKLDVKGMIEHHNIILNNMDGYLGLNLFHTFECYLLIFIMGLFFPVAHLVLMGFLFHHLFDQIQLSIMNRPFARAFSVVEYLIRKQHYFTSIKEVLENMERRENNK